MSVSIPEINALSPTVIAATESKTYPDYYVFSISLNSPDSSGDQVMAINFRPYNYATKEMYTASDKDKQLQIAIIATAQTSSLFAQGLGSIVAAVGMLQMINEINVASSKLNPDTDAAQIQAYYNQVLALQQALNPTA